MSRAEPRFDLDLSYGQEGEKLIGAFLSWIAEGNNQIEVKRKSYLDLEFYVETHCDKGRTGTYQPSGISVTTATAWAFVLGDTNISVIIPTVELRALLDDPGAKDRKETHGSCPTRGKLISLALALYRHKQRAKGIVRAPLPDKVEHTPAALPVTSCPSVTPPGTTHERAVAPNVDEIRW